MEKRMNPDKFELLEMDVGKLRRDIQNDISMDELYVLKEDELDFVQNMIDDSIELELALEEPVENTKASFYVQNGQMIVIKVKKLNVKRLIFLLTAAENFVTGDKLTRVCVVFGCLVKQLIQVVDKDLSKVYFFLAYEYFHKGRKFNNTEIFDAVNQYIKESLDVSWADQKIQEKLDQLEDELRVIACIDGIYEVKDKIHFV